MATHVKMPDDRSGIVHRFVIGGPDGLSGYITAGLYLDGTLGEIFLFVHRVGGLDRGMANALAIQISMSLQHGVPLAKIVAKLKGQTFEPRGLTDNKAIPMCRSLADYLGRWLELKFAEQIRKENENVGIQPATVGECESEKHGKGAGGQREADSGGPLPRESAAEAGPDPGGCGPGRQVD